MKKPRWIVVTAPVLLALVAMPSAHATTAYLDPVSDRMWRQVTDTLGIDYAGALQVCASDICNGAYAGVDFTGWTWATSADVNQLFRNFGIPGFSGSGFAGTSQIDSSWAPRFVDIDGSGGDTGAFEATLRFMNLGGAGGVVHGIIRDRLPTRPWEPVGAGVEDGSPGERDYATIGTSVMGSTRSMTGVWLFQPAATVPSPGTAPLALLALAACGLCRRHANDASKTILDGSLRC